MPVLPKQGLTQGPVGIVRSAAVYPTRAPYHPTSAYPEYPLSSRDISNDTNPAYDAVRGLFRVLDLDSTRFGTANWNPLGKMIRPGDHVLLKPNLVLHPDERSPETHDALITHGSVIRAVLDYVQIALGGTGRITVGDAPLQRADFDRILERTGLNEICQAYKAQAGLAPVHIRDFRLERVEVDDRKIIRSRHRLPESAGHQVVDLGSRSFLGDLDEHSKRYRVTCYDPKTMSTHHNATRHEYLVAKDVLHADVIVALPKMKTHRKAGMTVSLKSLVGINGHKDWLPHHRIGSIRSGGDEYLHASFRKAVLSKLLDLSERIDMFAARRFVSFVTRALLFTGRVLPFKDGFMEGSWYGNDTLWRMVLDLNRILVFADSKGEIQDEAQRKYLSIVDAIVGGAGEGPLEPTPQLSGVLLGGFDPVSVDLVAAALMGFDFEKIPTLRNALKAGLWRSSELGSRVAIRTDIAGWQSMEEIGKHHLSYTPAAGWAGHIECPDHSSTGSPRGEALRGSSATSDLNPGDPLSESS